MVTYAYFTVLDSYILCEYKINVQPHMYNYFMHLDISVSFGRRQYRISSPFDSLRVSIKLSNPASYHITIRVMREDTVGMYEQYYKYDYSLYIHSSYVCMHNEFM